jgi:hypothetical protein
MIIVIRSDAASFPVADKICFTSPLFGCQYILFGVYGGVLWLRLRLYTCKSISIWYQYLSLAIKQDISKQIKGIRYSLMFIAKCLVAFINNKKIKPKKT